MLCKMHHWICPIDWQAEVDHVTCHHNSVTPCHSIWFDSFVKFSIYLPKCAGISVEVYIVVLTIMQQNYKILTTLDSRLNIFFLKIILKKKSIDKNRNRDFRPENRLKSIDFRFSKSCQHYSKFCVWTHPLCHVHCSCCHDNWPPWTPMPHVRWWHSTVHCTSKRSHRLDSHPAVHTHCWYTKNGKMLNFETNLTWICLQTVPSVPLIRLWHWHYLNLLLIYVYLSTYLCLVAKIAWVTLYCERCRTFQLSDDDEETKRVVRSSKDKRSVYPNHSRN